MVHHRSKLLQALAMVHLKTLALLQLLAILKTLGLPASSKVHLLKALILVLLRTIDLLRLLPSSTIRSS
jgi:hypothetical protein